MLFPGFGRLFFRDYGRWLPPYVERVRNPFFGKYVIVFEEI
jgi:hypothetical protein